ncbi:hypothetical protein [Haloarcula pelagica]|uniref:hypothetical protein n=1 Tax=Haloarcula pelagica TaxID=3033389 RepID=UPI0024C38C33|nr:hypothetical protein [Halomicroarcula sp. YJ-61-S]
MRGIDSLREFATHPFSLFAAILTAIAQLFQVPFVDAAFGVLVSQSGTLFTITSVAAGTFAPQVSWLPVEHLQVAALITGALYLLSKIKVVYMGFRKRLRGDDS